MSFLQQLVIYGAGGLGREILALVQDMDRSKTTWDILGFVDDDATPHTEISGLPVLGNKDYLLQRKTPVSVVLGFASPAAKASLYNELKTNPEISFPTIIHPSSCVEPRVQIGEGVLITRFCFVSVDAALGRCVFINAGSQVGHDTTVGDFTSIMPSVNISGDVSIGERCLIGVQSAILQGLSIGSGTTIGMGSIVLQNVPENCTAMGYPARVVKI